MFCARKEAKLVTPLNQAIQNTGKCPHGLPIGTCPICSGMGGGIRKDKNKPRVPGEMSYNECMAEWMKILAAKDAKIQARQDKIEASQQRLLENRIMSGLDKIQKNFDKLMQNIENLPMLLKTPIKVIAKIFIAPIINLISKIPNIIKNIQTFIQNTNNKILNLINSTTEKLAMIFGEIKNFANAFNLNKTKKALKTILSLMTEDENEEEENEEIQKLKARELKKILKGIFRTKRHPKEENNEESIV